MSNKLKYNKNENIKTNNHSSILFCFNDKSSIMFRYSLFDGIDYTALGHLHGAQRLREGLRYSGSPLAYSFSEAGHTKGSWLVELSAPGHHVVRYPVRITRDLHWDGVPPGEEAPEPVPLPPLGALGAGT